MFFSWLSRKLRSIVDEIDSEGDELVEHVISTKYYGLLQINGLYPLLRGSWMYFTLVQWFVYLLLLVVHWTLLLVTMPIMFKINFVLFSETVHYLVVVSLGMSVFFFVNFKRRHVARFHRAVHVGFYDYKENNKAILKKYNEIMLKEWGKLLLLPFAVTFTTVLILFISPFIDEYGTFDFDTIADKRVSFSVPIPLWYPFEVKGFYVTYALIGGQVMTGFVLGTVVAGGGIGFVSLTQFVTREFRVVLYSIDNMEHRAKSMYIKLYGRHPMKPFYDDKYYVHCYDLCYKKIHEHHKIILGAAEDVATVLAVPLFLAFTGGSLIIALAGLVTHSGSALPGKTFAAILECGVETCYMLLFAILGQRVTDLSEAFRDKLYHIRWYYYSRIIKRNMGIMQIYTVKPFEFSLHGMMPANLNTFSSVMNSAYSFYNLVMAAN